MYLNTHSASSTYCFLLLRDSVVVPRLMQDRISCTLLLYFFGPFIYFNKHSWALCPLTINFLFCFIFIWAVILAELSLALLHWYQTLVPLLYFKSPHQLNLSPPTLKPHPHLSWFLPWIFWKSPLCTLCQCPPSSTCKISQKPIIL